MDKQKIHYVADYILNATHQISIDLVGCGGSGSMMLSALARINSALVALGKPALRVTAYDDDEVEQTNVGRQLFCTNDIGMNKAVCLITRFNRCYGLSWQAIPEKYKYNKNTNIIISCTDNIASRKMISKNFKLAETTNRNNQLEYRNYYWIDLGNGQKNGQVVIGSTEIRQPVSSKYETVSKLKDVDELLHLSKRDEKESGPSCSLAEALSKQDLFINSTLAQLAGALLWKLLQEGYLDMQGVYLNLETMQTRPITIK